jgi:hypothetical protein
VMTSNISIVRTPFILLPSWYDIKSIVRWWHGKVARRALWKRSRVKEYLNRMIQTQDSK